MVYERMPYVEERDFNLRFELRCEFPDDYQGEADGYEWLAEWPAMAAEIVQAAGAAIRRRPGWQVRTGNRGRPTDEASPATAIASSKRTGTPCALRRSTISSARVTRSRWARPHAGAIAPVSTQ